MEISDITIKLDAFDEIIWKNEKEFLERFTKGGEELIELWWSIDELGIVFLSDSGATPFDVVSIKKIQTWFDEMEKS